MVPIEALLADAPKTWRFSDKGLQAVRHAIASRRTPYGFYASVPMICRANNCKFASVCEPFHQGLVQEGDRCVIEIAEIMERYQGYAHELGLSPDSVVDLGLLRDLIDCDLIIERADKVLAIEGEIIKYVTVGVTDSGHPIRRPEVHKALEIKERMQRRKNEILQLLNATRKDKARTNPLGVLDPSSHAAKLREIFEIYVRKETLPSENASSPSNPPKPVGGGPATS